MGGEATRTIENAFFDTVSKQLTVGLIRTYSMPHSVVMKSVHHNSPTGAGDDIFRADAGTWKGPIGSDRTPLHF